MNATIILKDKLEQYGRSIYTLRHNRVSVWWDQENHKKFRQDRRLLGRGSNAGSLRIKDNNHEINCKCDYRHKR